MTETYEAHEVEENDELSEVFDEILAPLQNAKEKLWAKIQELEVRQSALTTELRKTRERLKQTERLIYQVDPTQKPTTDAKPGKKTGVTGVGEERLQKARDYILEWFADEDRDYVTQTDLNLGIHCNSAIGSAIFAKLREEGFIRFVRQSGNRKFYRLSPAIREQLKAKEDADTPVN